MSNELIKIDIEIVKETDMAFLTTDGVIKAWLPKSQIESNELLEVGGTYTIEIPEWLAEEKELI